MTKYEQRLQKSIEFTKDGVIKNFNLNFNSKNNEKIEKLSEDLEMYKNKYFKIKEEYKNLSKNKRDIEEEDDIEDLKRENRELARKLQMFTRSKDGKKVNLGFMYLEISLNVNNFFVLGTVRNSIENNNNKNEDDDATGNIFFNKFK